MYLKRNNRRRIYTPGNKKRYNIKRLHIITNFDFEDQFKGSEKSLKMPSDYQKKKLAKKKEAAKQKGGKKPTANGVEENGVSNGTNGEIADKLGSVNGSKENSSEKTTYEGKLLFLLVEIWQPCLF